MIVIERFQAEIKEAVGENLVLQKFFLHHLFPETYDGLDCLASREAYQGQRSYVLVAADGFDWTSGGQTRFQAGMNWLVGIELPEDLLRHEIALLGITIGLVKHAQVAWKDWWETLLNCLRQSSSNRKLAQLLGVISGTEPPKFSSGSLDEYDLAQGLLSHPPQWDVQQMANYLVKMRKQPFPYFEDFFRLMLAVFLMDKSIALAMRSPAELSDLTKSAAARQAAETEKKLNAFLERRARIIVSLAVSLGFVMMVMACGLLFVWQPQAPQMRNLWDDAKWVTLWLSGPISTLLLSLRILWFAFRRQPMQLDFERLHRWYHALLVRRWQRRLGFIPHQNP